MTFGQRAIKPCFYLQLSGYLDYLNGSQKFKFFSGKTNCLKLLFDTNCLFGVLNPILGL